MRMKFDKWLHIYSNKHGSGVICDEVADVRENVRGEWVDFSMSIKGVPTEACGVCGEWSLGMGKNYCPNCGADMRGGDAK